MTAALAIVIVLVLACDVAHSEFVTTPNVIVPKQTNSVLLRCDPRLQDGGTILAIHMRKKPDQTAAEVLQAADEIKSDVTTQPVVQQEASPQVTEKQEPKLPDLPTFNDALDNKRRKRFTDTDFVRATITAGNVLDIVPPIDRFKADGDVQKPAYLSVTIENPDVNDLGVYECQATFLDSTFTVQTTSEVCQLKETEELTLDDLEIRVKKLEEKLPVYTVVIREAENLAKNANSINKQLDEDMVALRKETDELKQTVLELTKQTKGLSDRVTLISEQFGLNGPPANYEILHSQDDNNQPQGVGEYRSDSAGIQARKEQVINSHIQNLAKHLTEVRDYLRDTQDRVALLELTVKVKHEERIQKLEGFDWPGLTERLQDIETKTIPLIQKNVMDCQSNITALQLHGEVQDQIDESQVEHEISPLIEPQTPDVTTPETTPKTYTGPACYVCGNNETEEHCPLSMAKNTMECPSQAPYCLTDVYQNGFTRHVYKRCISVKECRILTSESSPNCATDNFSTATAMQCHFCCTSILCNDYIRPSKDLI